jgi:hypothetical protein
MDAMLTDCRRELQAARAWEDAARDAGARAEEGIVQRARRE